MSSSSTGSACADRLTICASDEWDNDAWKAFSQDHVWKSAFSALIVAGRTSSVLWRAPSFFVLPAKRNPAPRSKEVARGLVNTALRIRSPRKKIALLRSALARDADCSSARIELADVEFQHGNWKVCLAAYDEVIARETPRWQRAQVPIGGSIGRPGFFSERCTAGR